MKFELNRLTLALAGVASLSVLTLVGCGGGGGSTAPDTSTTAVSTTVIDGALQNAVVCVDANSNGECDAGELQGKTDAAGNVTLAVPNGDVGKYPLVAVVGTDAVDIDTGPVTEAFTLSSPAGKSGVVTPLTTMVHQAMGAGLTVEEAENSVKGASGINVSLFQDFTTAAAKAEAAAAGGSNPADVARMIVVTTQKQSVDLKSTEGADAIDGTKISRKDISKALRKKLLELLPSMANALNDPATAALTGKAKEDAVVGALGGSLMTAAALKTEVAISNQANTPPEAYVASSGFSLTHFDFTDANNWFVRVNAASLAQATLDGEGKFRYVQRRARSEGGAIARWNANSQPRFQSNIFWSGTGWTSWPLNCEGTSTVDDARGNSVYVGCNNAWTGKSNRGALFDVSGKTMASVMEQMNAAGYNNLKLANLNVLGSATFPANSKLRYQTSTDTSSAVGYSSGSDNLIQLYPRAAGTPAACAMSNPPTSPLANTLEAVVATFVGKPCSYPADTIVSNGVTYASNGPMVIWGDTSLGMGQIGTAAVSSTPTSYFTGNTRVRLAFTGSGSNEVTYYACQQRQVNGSTRNCVETGAKGTYSIATVGDARVMTFTNPPAIRSSLDSEQVFVERGGKVYYGYQAKLKTTSGARLNTTAANALFVQLGMAPGDAEVPLALTPVSYQGTWDTTDPAGPAGNGSVLVFNGNGTPTCSDKPTGASFSCSFTVTNPTTGAFTGLNNSNGSVLAGTLNFLTGAGSGTYTMPSPGTFVATRR